jgi:NADH:ubiquinone oxidoreductase subunit K
VRTLRTHCTTLTVAACKVLAVAVAVAVLVALYTRTRHVKLSQNTQLSPRSKMTCLKS